MKKINKTGSIITIATIVAFCIERLSGNKISHLLAEIFCGTTYVENIDQAISEMSCGFNADMHMATFFLLLLVAGIAMLLWKNVKILKKPSVFFLFIGLIIFIGGYFGTLFIAHRFNPDFLKIDNCLDNGGTWDYQQKTCPLLVEISICETSGKEWNYEIGKCKNEEKENIQIPLLLNEELWAIESFSVDCEGITPQKCLIVNNEYFYDTVEGFEYEEGYEYVLKVQKEEIFSDEIPADANPYRYILIEEISKEKTE